VAKGAQGSGPTGMQEHERLAWVNNGYANHFLQDSFAAGHLINKTLVMQWFVEYINSRSFGDRPHFGLPDAGVMKDMTTKAQPGLASRSLYGSHRLHTTATQDRASTTGPADPQTTQERTTGRGRFEGAGIRDAGRGRAYAYAEYDRFLNSSFINMAAGNAHDFLNTTGLTVANRRGDQFKVGGDGTLLFESSDVGLRLPFEADQLSDKAISDLLSTGRTSVTQEAIFDLFPSSVVVKGKPVPLEQWNDTELRRLCFEIIFPPMMGDMKMLRAQVPQLIEGGHVADLPVRQQ